MASSLVLPRLSSAKMGRTLGRMQASSRQRIVAGFTSRRQCRIDVVSLASSRHFNRSLGSERNRSTIVEPDTNVVILDHAQVYDDVETSQPAHKHSALKLADARKGRPEHFQSWGFSRGADSGAAARRPNRARRDPRARSKRSAAALAVALCAGCASAVALPGGGAGTAPRPAFSVNTESSKILIGHCSLAGCRAVPKDAPSRLHR